MTAPRRRQVVGLLVLLVLALAAGGLRVLIGRDLEHGITFAWPSPRVAWVRWTALAIGTTVGTALAVSGVLLQALLRNPLASPSLLGVSAGAGLGVMAAMYVGYKTGSDPLRSGTASGFGLIGPFAGALAVLVLVYVLSQRRGWIDPVSLVLVGVIISAMCGALIMVLQHLVPMGLNHELLRWLMGRIKEDVARGTLAAAATVAAVGLAISLALGRAMDAATLDDDEARSVGLDVGPLRVGLYLLAGAMTAVSVGLCGPIGFVGLVAPHAARLVIGPRHTALVLGAALCGVVLVVGADVGRQAIDLGGGRMPIGVFTTLIGGPAFIWLLWTRQGQA